MFDAWRRSEGPKACEINCKINSKFFFIQQLPEELDPRMSGGDFSTGESVVQKKQKQKQKNPDKLFFFIPLQAEFIKSLPVTAEEMKWI